MSDQPHQHDPHADLDEVQHTIDDAKQVATQLHHDAPNQFVENDEQVPEEGEAPAPG